MHNSLLSVALALAGIALAQSSTTTALPAASPITIVGGPYDGQEIAGKHVGAAQSYQVALDARTGASVNPGGDQFFFNETSNQFMDETIVAGYEFPCYIISASVISNNSGPLECGAAGSDSQRQTGALGDDGTLYIVGVQSWWMCSVNATSPYGVIPATVVAGFTTDEPVGPGISNCTEFQALRLGGGGSPTSTSTTITSISASSTTLATTKTTIKSDAGTSSSPLGPTLTTVTGGPNQPTSTPPATGTTLQASSTTSSSGASGTTFTGAATSMMHDMSSVAFAAVAGAFALLL